MAKQVQEIQQSPVQCYWGVPNAYQESNSWLFVRRFGFYSKSNLWTSRVQNFLICQITDNLTSNSKNQWCNGCLTCHHGLHTHTISECNIMEWWKDQAAVWLKSRIPYLIWARLDKEQNMGSVFLALPRTWLRSYRQIIYHFYDSISSYDSTSSSIKWGSKYLHHRDVIRVKCNKAENVLHRETMMQMQYSFN